MNLPLPREAGSSLGNDRLELRSYALVAAAGAMWGGMGVLAKLLYAAGVTPWSLVFYRALLGTLACGLAILVLNRSWFAVRREDLPFLALYGLVSTSAFFTLYLLTLSLTSVAVAVVLLYTAPVFAAAMARVAFGEPFTALKISALGLTLAGCVLVTGLQSGQLAAGILGAATGLGSALTYGAFGVLGKHARRRYGPLTILFYSMAFGTLFLLPVLALPDAHLGPYSPDVWFLLLLIAAGPTLLSRVFYVAAVKHIEASRAAIVATIEPVVAAVLAAIALGELLSPGQVVGGMLVIAGSILAQQRGGGR